MTNANEETKEVEELAKSLMESISKENSTWNSFEIVAKRLISKGWHRTPKDNGLVAIDEESVRQVLRGMYSDTLTPGNMEEIPKRICSKFGQKQSHKAKFSVEDIKLILDYNLNVFSENNWYEFRDKVSTVIFNLINKQE